MGLERLLRSPGSSGPRTGRRGFVRWLEVRRAAASGAFSPPPPAPPPGLVSLLLFNIHLEKLNLASWKPAHRIKFLETSRVFHFPRPAMLRFPLVGAFENPGSCLTAFPTLYLCRPFTPTLTRPEGGAVAPQAGAEGRFRNTCLG